MKALKSSLAKQLLADPKARAQLQQFLATPVNLADSAPEDSKDSVFIAFSPPGGTPLKIKPRFVGKAF